MKSLIAVLLLVIAGMPDIAAASKTEKTKWVDSEVVTSYVSGTSPTLILGLDTNLEICLALREARTISELRSDSVPVTDSQLILLQLWRLIERSDDGKMRCTVPIIESPATNRTRGSRPGRDGRVAERPRSGYRSLRRDGAGGRMARQQLCAVGLVCPR
ncbi:MAG: hypothetical protein GTO29_08710 [Candidatus Latescibacteria bacterium]|nr:hypothetical protein [Candidatus Latescibacterota bacterium]NIO56243.1 hypothetical protein [Candidatus Latescibacterota bacterium]